MIRKNGRVINIPSELIAIGAERRFAQRFKYIFDLAVQCRVSKVDAHIIFYAIGKTGVAIVFQIIKENAGSCSQCTIYNRYLPVFAIVHLTPAWNDGGTKCCLARIILMHLLFFTLSEAAVPLATTVFFEMLSVWEMPVLASNNTTSRKNNCRKLFSLFMYQSCGHISQPAHPLSAAIWSTLRLNNNQSVSDHCHPCCVSISRGCLNAMLSYLLFSGR